MIRLLLLLIALHGLPDPATAATPVPFAPTHAVPGWFLGMPVLLFAAPPPAGIDRRSIESFPIYVHAPVSASAGAAATKVVPHPRTGKPVTLPSHQDTLSALNSEAKPRLGVGYFVIAGPRATADTVRLQDQPEASWPSRPLASHILIGPEWVGVNNHLVVEYGLATGQLALEYFDVGGMMWGEFVDSAARQLGSIEVSIGHATPLPAIDWEHDKDHQPGQAPAAR